MVYGLVIACRCGQLAGRGFLGPGQGAVRRRLIAVGGRLLRGDVGSPGGPCRRTTFGGCDAFRQGGWRRSYGGYRGADGMGRARRTGRRTQFGQDRCAEGRTQQRLRCRDNRRLQALRQAVGDQRDTRAAADRGDCGQPMRRNLIASQHICDTIDEALQGFIDEFLELAPVQPDVRSNTGKISRDDGDRRR
jgi:hypothetical protein